MQQTRTRPLIVGLLTLPMATPARGADQSLGSFKDWSAMAFGSGKDITCMAFSQPVKSEGEYSKRGDVFVFVAHRPGEKQAHRVSVEIGYKYASDAQAGISIDEAKFSLKTDGSTAWLASDDLDPELVKAMKAGRQMVVEGTSSRGTRTRDEYSLLGFTAAVQAIDRACKMP